MNGFKTASLTQQTLDPYKRVKYSFGLVLGEDEFNQDQLYLMERDQLHNRALHGYGTVWGLKVSIRNRDSDPEVVVLPGIAVDPKGQTIRVPEAQCARLNGWLARNQTTVTGGTLTLYVRLCYRECETDTVPVPGAPCRSQEESMAASRIADEFELSLTLEPPKQAAEDVVRCFGALLNRIEISSQPGSLTEQQLINLVRGLPAKVSPGGGSQHSGGAEARRSQPATPALRKLHLHPDDACEILHSAFRVWVTEVRPVLLAGGSGSGSGGAVRAATENKNNNNGNEACVLLAELRVPVVSVNNAWQVNGSIEINEERRPVLLHTRLLQEWLLCGGTPRADNVRTFATLFTQSMTAIRAWIHHPVLLNIPRSGVTIDVNGVLSTGFTITQHANTNVFDFGLKGPLSDGDRIRVRFDSQRVREANSQRALHIALEEQDYAYLDREGVLIAYLTADLPALNDLTDVNAPKPSHGQALIYRDNRWVPSDHGHLAGLRDDDHPQYLRADGTRALTGEQSAGGNKITNLAEATNNGDALPFGQKAGGDLSGAYPSPTVNRLQGRTVDPNATEDGQVLTWNQEQQQWEPQTPRAGGTSALDELTDVSAPDPTEGQVLTYQGGQWQPADQDNSDPGDHDHPHDHPHDHDQYLRTDGTLPLTGNQSAGNNKITNLAEATNSGDALPFGQKAGGDLRGTYPNPAVNRLQGRTVAPTRPEKGQTLTWNEQEQQWEPQSPQAGGARTLNQLTDVNAPSPRDQYVLTWDQRQQRWKPQRIGPSTLNSLTDVNAPSPGNQYILAWNQEEQQWIPRIPLITGPRTLTLNELEDVNASSPQGGQVLTWDQRLRQWVPRLAPTGWPAGPAVAGERATVPVSPYAVVAAGIFDASGHSQRPVYGGLTASNQGSGYFLLRFSSYTNDPSITYIVKGTAQPLDRESQRATFEFIAFEEDGILVRALSIQNEPIDPGSINEPTDTGFMVEISQFIAGAWGEA